MSISKYHVSKNLVDVSPFTITAGGGSYNTVLFNGTLESGTYTISLNQENTLTSSTRNTIRVNANGTAYYESTSINYHNELGLHSYTFTVYETSNVEIYFWSNTFSNSCTYSNIMLNSGSTALPYEPYGNTFKNWFYRKRETATDTITTFPKSIIGDGQSASAVIKGNMSQSGTPTPASPIYPTETGDLVASGEHSGQYQIPILSGGVTTPVYLGQVQSTRRIKKYEFTGREAFYASSQTSVFYSTAIASDALISYLYNTGCICSSYKLRKQSTAANLLDGEFTTDSNGYIWFRNYDYATLTDFQAYLAQQYSAGTPVTVWYTLAEPTTGILNEPLRKIGAYADSVTATNIPTTGTAEQFDIDTTLKPSEVSLTYHGWHEHSDTKFT